MLKRIKKKFQNWKLNNFQKKQKIVRENLKNFDKRLDQYPEELQRAKKFAYLQRNKQYLDKSEYEMWKEYLIADIFEDSEELDRTDLHLY